MLTGDGLPLVSMKSLKGLASKHRSNVAGIGWNFLEWNS